MISIQKYRERQHKRTLGATIWIVFVATTLMGFFNLDLHEINSAVAIFATSAACLLALIFNRRDHYHTSAILVCAAALVSLTFSIVDGDGLYDPGVVGYPLLIILGILLLGKRAAPWLTLANIVSLLLVTYLQSIQFIQPTIRNDDVSNWVIIAVFLAAAALIIWVILQNFESNERRISQSERELIESYDYTIEGWARALELRDYETAGHSQRVVEKTVNLARALGCAEEELVNIRRGAILHDIGKLGVPDSILKKTGRLTPEEWELMHQHPLYAKEMLSKITFLRPSLDIPCFHHEHWDGSGYPFHYQGEQIPLAARIFSIVDVWDALLSNRPYRPAWTVEETFAFIQSEAGKQFDPRIVPIFLQMMREMYRVELSSREDASPLHAAQPAALIPPEPLASPK